MTVNARPRGLARFRSLVQDFSEAIVEGKERTQHLAVPSGDLVHDPEALREALEELRAHQEELSVADEEMHVQLEELSVAHTRVHAERDRYRELFDAAPDAYFVTDRVGVIRDVNAAGATMLGIEPRFLLGKPLTALVDAADTRLLRDAMSALRGRASAGLELRLKPRTSDARWHSVKGVNVEQGSAILWIARDVQEHHDASAALSSASQALDVATRQRELERANRDRAELLERERHLRVRLEEEHVAKDRFLSVLSHDLRAPLNAVLGWTQLLRREKLDESARDRGLATIERNARAQLRLLEELLDLSRLARGGAQLERFPVELRELVQRPIEGVAAEAGERKVEVRVALGEEALLVAGDRRRLEQVVSNLLSNALKFTPPGGRVTLTLDHDGTTARLEVADTGRGIAPDLLPRVFDAFHDASTDYGTSSEGLGLGLYVVRQVVTMHGGEVVAESPGIGLGSRFVATLPLAGASKARLPARAAHGAVPPDGPRADLLDGLSVLVVDDEDDARELMAAVLRQRGAVVTVAADVRSALQAFSISQPDVLVSDMAMPGRSGLDLARELRSRPMTTAAMIVVSGFTSPEDVVSSLEAGFDMHVAKPVDPDDLVDAVRDAARLRVH